MSFAAPVALSVGYLLGAGAFAYRSADGPANAATAPASRLLSVILRLYVAAVLAGHGYLLSNHLLAQASPGGALDLGFGNAISLVAWLVVLSFWVTSLLRPVDNLGPIILTLAALSVLAMAGLQEHYLVNMSQAMYLHIVLSLGAYSLLTIAALQAVFILLLDRRLHHKRGAGMGGRLPPLQNMERLLFQLLLAGFSLLSLSLGAGALFVPQFFSATFAPKAVLSLCAWLIFGVLLLGHWRAGWRGKVTAAWTLGGFSLLALAYFGTKLWLEAGL